MDEKDFLINICNAMKQIISKYEFKCNKLLGVSQNGFQEFIFLLIGICIDGIYMLPKLIYQNKLSNMINS